MTHALLVLAVLVLLFGVPVGLLLWSYYDDEGDIW
jgi:hypothetical protein